MNHVINNSWRSLTSIVGAASRVLDAGYCYRCRP